MLDKITWTSNFPLELINANLTTLTFFPEKFSETEIFIEIFLKIWEKSVGRIYYLAYRNFKPKNGNILCKTLGFDDLHAVLSVKSIKNQTILFDFKDRFINYFEML